MTRQRRPTARELQLAQALAGMGPALVALLKYNRLGVRLSAVELETYRQMEDRWLDAEKLLLTAEELQQLMF